MTDRSTAALFSPTSVAVVGASEDPRKWGNWLARGALRGESRRPAYLINHRAAEVLGRRAYASLDELPERPDLVVIAVPVAALAVTVDAALVAGARAIVAITAGGSSAELDADLAARVREAGAVLLGPNCLGVLDSGEQLEMIPNPLPAGSIGLISQSGNLALELGLLAAPEGLGFSRFVSLGNQADLGATELIEEFAAHDATELIALYIEDFRDGRAFARAAAEAVTAGKPVVALAIEQGGATTRAVRSHTGALASDGAAIDAAFRAAGIERVRTPRELIDTAQALLRCPPSGGRRIGVLADGGGHGSIAAAVAAEVGLNVPELPAATAASLRGQLPLGAAVTNPVDLAGGAEQDVHTFDRIARQLLESGDVDALLITGYFGGYAEYSPEMEAQELRAAGLIAEAARSTGRPVVAHTMYPRVPAAAALREAGVPVYETVEQAAGALARLAGHAERTARPGGPSPRGPSGSTHGMRMIPILNLSRAAPPGPDSAAPPGPDSAPPGPDSDSPAPGHDYTATRALLAAAGIPFVAQRTVTSAAEAVAAARQLGFPVVLKALGLLHKSDAGGVVLGLADDAAVRDAYRDLQARLAPQACSVELMAPLSDGVELLIGTRWDARFGPVVLAGSGGIYTEILRDTAVALAPVGEDEAESMLRSLRAAPLLTGIRGRRPTDLGAAARALAALSRVAAAHPELAELEINPLLVTPTGAVALDARAVPATPPTQEPTECSSPTPQSSSRSASVPAA